MTDKVFGKFTVLERDYSRKDRRYWWCQFKNKFFVYSFIAIVLVRITTIAYITKLIEINSILIYLRFVDKLIIIVTLVCIPILFATWLLMFVNNLLCKEQIKFQVYENILYSDENETIEYQ